MSLKVSYCFVVLAERAAVKRDGWGSRFHTVAIYAISQGRVELPSYNYRLYVLAVELQALGIRIHTTCFYVS